MKRIVASALVLFLAISVNAQIVSDKKGENGKWGFVDANNNWIVRPQYDYTYWDKDGRIGLYEIKSISRSARGLLDETGREIFPVGQFKSYYRSTNNNNYIEVTNLNDKKGVATIDGKMVLSCAFKETWIDARDNIIMVTDFNDKKGYYSFEGKQLTPIAYDEIWRRDNYYNAYNYIGTDTIEGLLSSEGKELLPCKYKEIQVVIDNKVIFAKTKNGKEGVFDLNGKIVLAPELYDEVNIADNDLFSVKKNNQWGIWYKGKEIIPCQYDDAIYFVDDVAKVKRNGEVSLIKNPLKDASKIKIAGNAVASNKKKLGGPAVSRYPAPDSDVDKNIPVAKQQNVNTFAFIIANENYPDAPVPYSLNDGRMFKDYCHKTLGLPEKNINLYEDATFGTIITAVEKMKQIADAYEGEASVIFYYAGHGFPDDKQSTAYLLPIDGDASSITTTGYSLAKLYKEISNLKLKSSVVFLDACFSGAKREDQMLASSRGVAIKVKDEAPQGNMVVFSAAQGDETAHQLEDKHHGLFTYCLLKELQTAGGDVDLGTLTTNVTKQVKRQSVVINNKKQTPTVIPSQALANSWQTMKLK